MAHLLGVLVLLENFESKNVSFMLKQAQIFNRVEHKFYIIFKMHSRFQRNLGLWTVLPSPQEYMFMRSFENTSFFFFLYGISSVWDLITFSTLPFLLLSNSKYFLHEAFADHMLEILFFSESLFNLYHFIQNTVQYMIYFVASCIMHMSLLPL